VGVEKGRPPVCWDDLLVLCPLSLVDLEQCERERRVVPGPGARVGVVLLLCSFESGAVLLIPSVESAGGAAFYLTVFSVVDMAVSGLSFARRVVQGGSFKAGRSRRVVQGGSFKAGRSRRVVQGGSFKAGRSRTKSGNRRSS
jgi:hypothetical protein